jgi:hypothetical protein
MSIDGVGAKKPRGASLDQIECILNEFGAPSTVRARMGNTRALDGTQDASSASLRATWTYHPRKRHQRRDRGGEFDIVATARARTSDTARTAQLATDGVNHGGLPHFHPRPYTKA